MPFIRKVLLNPYNPGLGIEPIKVRGILDNWAISFAEVLAGAFEIYGSPPRQTGVDAGWWREKCKIVKKACRDSNLDDLHRPTAEADAQFSRVVRDAKREFWRKIVIPSSRGTLCSFRPSRRDLS